MGNPHACELGHAVSLSFVKVFLRIMRYVVWYSWQFAPDVICGCLSCDLCVWVECLDGDSLNWVMLSSLRSVRLACWLKCLGASLSRAIFS